MTACRVCKNVIGNKVHLAREMMFGMRDQFHYLECAQCGCLQLLDVPADLARYYPSNYYSYRKHGSILTALRRRWSEYAFGKSSFLGWALSMLLSQNRPLVTIRGLDLLRTARILDVGCGCGLLLSDLHHLGFSSVTGVDPYIEHDIVHDHGFVVYKKELNQLNDEFDLIMLNHSFEHLSDPLQNLLNIKNILSRNGRVILRIPVASSYGWKHYGVNWVHLDAPRHLFLHTNESIRLLATQSGLTVTEIIHESDESTFWYSEAYSQDIPMFDARVPIFSHLGKLLSWSQTKQYRARADELNRKGEADLLCFILRKSNSLT